MAKKNFYDIYHVITALQKRIIDKNNFTYRNILGVACRYAIGRNKILDIGCGVGTIDFFLAKKGKTVVGIDISENATRTAAENAKLFGLTRQLSFRRMNFPAKFPKQKYDFILCSEVIEHLPKEKLAIKRFRQLLRKKGRVFISAPSENSLLFRLGLTQKHDKWAGHLRRYTTERLTGLFENSGFKIIYTDKREGILRESLFIFPPLGIIVKLANKFAFIGNLISYADNFLLRIFGESDVVVVAEKT
ncbi:class I SAM-dependent methyltransferase [Patescibacteria group bacterium]|nr:class I SAM-dependent methyltransferase [Patescibacteria group bacterium]